MDESKITTYPAYMLLQALLVLLGTVHISPGRGQGESLHRQFANGLVNQKQTNIKTTMKTSPFLLSLKTALFGLLLLTASCKKNNDIITPGGDSSLACAGKNLRMTALTFDPAVDLDGDGKVDNDLLKFMNSCALDNTINFEKSGKLSGSEGANVCPGGADGPVSTEASTWTYNAQSHILRIVPNGNPSETTEWNVQDVSASRIKATIVTESADGDQL